MDEKKEMSLVMRIMSYFGMTRSECMEEYKALPGKDKERFVKEFCEMGLPTTLKKVP